MNKQFCLLFLSMIAAATTHPVQAAWTYHPQGDPNNPTNVACIADGNWIVQVYARDASTGTLTLGKGQWYCGILAGQGVLDLRGNLATYDEVDYRLKN